MLDAARGAHPAHALRHRDGWQSYLSRGRKAVLGNPRTHPADRGKVAPQAQAPAPLAQTAHLSRYLSASSPPGFGRKFLPIWESTSVPGIPAGLVQVSSPSRARKARGVSASIPIIL